MKIHIDELEAQLQDAEERVLERENAHLRMAATYQKKIKELTAQLQSAKSEAWDACYVSMIQNSNGELNENAIDADKAAYIGQ
jgi:cell division septum initiation protein DivIVA